MRCTDLATQHRGNMIPLVYTASPRLGWSSVFILLNPNCAVNLSTLWWLRIAILDPTKVMLMSVSWLFNCWFRIFNKFWQFWSKLRPGDCKYLELIFITEKKIPHILPASLYPFDSVRHIFTYRVLVEHRMIQPDAFWKLPLNQSEQFVFKY